MRLESIAYLLDCSPTAWDTKAELHWRLCRRLRASGVQPILVFSEELPVQITERFSDAGAVVRACAFDRSRLGYYRQIGALVQQYRVGLVHVRFFDYFSAIPWLARLQGVPHIVYTEANSGEWAADSWRAHLVRLRARLACQPISRFIAISEFIKRRLIRVGIAEAKIDVVYNGVDTGRFVPDPGARERLARDLPITPGDFVIAGAFSLLPWKQPAVLLDACALLARRGVPIRLLVAGAGPLLAELQARSLQLGLAERTHWFGHSSRLETVLQACDVFVLPSVGEAFGNVLAEAMACGVPVVASRSGGIPEVVDDGVTGRLVDPSNPAAFADAIERLACDTALRRKMGRCAIDCARQRFNVDSAVEGTVRVYEGL